MGSRSQSLQRSGAEDVVEGDEEEYMYEGVEMDEDGEPVPYILQSQNPGMGQVCRLD